MNNPHLSILLAPHCFDCYILCLRPRGGAVGERLWSSADMTKDSAAAMPRMEEHRCRMLKFAMLMF